MIQVLTLAFVNAIIIGVFFWVLQELISLIPLNATFAKLANIIIILLVLILAYDIVVTPLANVFQIHLPKLH